MKKIYEAFPQINIKGEWLSCTMHGRTRALSPEIAENSMEVFYNTFDELFEACANGKITNAYTSKGFKGKRICHLPTLCRDFAYRITEKNFTPIGFRWDCREVKNPSLDYLMKYLPADDFIEWLAEKNISKSFIETIDKLRKK
jgi:hypothetical protein